MVVGAGEWLLRKVGKEKKSEQASGAAAGVGASSRMHVVRSCGCWACCVDARVHSGE